MGNAVGALKSTRARIGSAHREACAATHWQRAGVLPNDESWLVGRLPNCCGRECTDCRVLARGDRMAQSKT
eukprot:2661228-Pyramimonas_sp.AAC.1